MKRKLAIIVILSFILSIVGGCGRGSELSSQAAKLSSNAQQNSQQQNGQGPNNSPEKNNGLEPNSSSNSSSMPTSGVYWETYSNIPDTSDSPDDIKLDEPYYVEIIEIGEPSTSELVATIQFPPDQNVVYYSTPATDNAQYWVERVQDKEGRTTLVKIASTGANNFYINLRLYGAKSHIPALYITGMKSDDGVHAPDGSILSDPYKNPETPIAGFKNLKFNASFEEGTKIRNQVEEAGYETFSMRYNDGVYEFCTMKDLDSRAKIEELAVNPNGWKRDENLTKGNVGVYSNSDSFTGSITIQWNYVGAPFTIEIPDAKLVMRDDGPDETNYTLTGTAEIKPRSFTLGGQIYTLSDSPKKPVNLEYGFKVIKTPAPAVRWSYAETWTYKDKAGVPFGVTITYSTNKSPSELGEVSVADLDKIDGSYNMSFMMPSFGGTATWGFQKDN